MLEEASDFWALSSPFSNAHAERSSCAACAPLKRRRSAFRVYGVYRGFGFIGVLGLEGSEHAVCGVCLQCMHKAAFRQGFFQGIAETSAFI